MFSYCPHFLQGFSKIRSIAQDFHINNMVFSKKGYQLLKTLKENCTGILKQQGNTTEACFYGIFMGHLMEEGFGMTDNAKHNWEVKFPSKASLE